MISVFGSTGFIGSTFCKKHADKCIKIPKEINKPESNNILYFISTVDNYNVHDNPYLDIETNLIKLVSVLEECKKIKQQTQNKVIFNFISSWFVYGKINEFPATETTICNPTGFYSITKYAAEKLLISYCETFNIDYRILRLTNIIGNTDKKVSNKKNALQFMINKLKQNELIKLYDNGSNIRDYMDVEDCCDAINVCLQHAPLGEIINVTNNEPKTIGEIINYAKQKLNSSSMIQSMEAPEFHKIVQIKNMWLDNKKLLSYGYIPKTTVFDAVDKILDSL